MLLSASFPSVGLPPLMLSAFARFGSGWLSFHISGITPSRDQSQGGSGSSPCMGLSLSRVKFPQTLLSIWLGIGETLAPVCWGAVNVPGFSDRGASRRSAPLPVLGAVGLALQPVEQRDGPSGARLADVLGQFAEGLATIDGPPLRMALVAGRHRNQFPTGFNWGAAGLPLRQVYGSPCLLDEPLSSKLVHDRSAWQLARTPN
jgi:hypothetical protein